MTKEYYKNLTITTHKGQLIAEWHNPHHNETTQPKHQPHREVLEHR